MKSLVLGLLAAATLSIGLIATPAQADIMWDITYHDTNAGFNDASQGASRRSTFESALSYVSDVLNENGTVKLDVFSENVSNSSTLAYAGSLFFTGGGFQQGLVQQSILGNSINIGQGHGSATFNFGKNWNSTLAAPSGGQFDLFTVSLHEITHALGFSSLMKPNGMSPIKPTGGQDSFSNTFSTFDQYLELSNGTEFFTNSTFTATTDANMDGVADVLQSGEVVFTGANAMAANSGNAVSIYSPAVYNDGSSISHIVGASDVMQFSIAPNVMRRAYSEVEIGMLKDIGYVNAATVVVSVPEPSSLALVAFAFSGAGVIVSRRKRRKTTLK